MYFRIADLHVEPVFSDKTNFQGAIRKPSSNFYKRNELVLGSQTEFKPDCRCLILYTTAQSRDFRFQITVT